MTGGETLEAFFQKFKLIKANLEEAEAHKGPLTNAREILADLRKMFLVAGARSVDYQIVADGNTRLANELEEARGDVKQLHGRVNDRNAEIVSFTGTVTNMHAEAAAVHKENLALKAELRVAQTTIRSQRVTSDTLQAKFETRDNTTRLLKNDNKELGVQIRKLGAQLRELGTKVSNHEVSYKSLWDANKKERAVLQGKIDAQESLLNQRDSAVGALTYELKELHVELNSKDARLEEMGG